MKRIVLMVRLLVAGGLALVYLVSVTLALLRFAIPSAATGSGGIGSVSADPRGSFIEFGLMLLVSVLLWRACASLAAEGDRVMARHRRIHGVASIAGLLLMAGFMGLFAMALRTGPGGMPPPVAIRDPEGLLEVLLTAVLVALVMLPLAAFVLALFQLFSAVVAFRMLIRGGRETLEAS